MRTCPKKTQTQRHGTLVVHTCKLRHTGLLRLDHSVSTKDLEPRPHREGSETKEINEVSQAGPSQPSQKVTPFLHAITKLSHDGPPSQLRNFSVSWFGRTDMRLFKITQEPKTTAPHFKRNKKCTASLKCTIDTCTAQHLRRLDAAHTVGGADVVVQRPNEASPSDRFKKRQLEKKSLARCVLRVAHKAHLTGGCHRRRSAT